MSSAEAHRTSDGAWEAKRKELAMKWFFFRVEWAMLANEQAFWGGVSKCIVVILWRPNDAWLTLQLRFLVHYLEQP